MALIVEGKAIKVVRTAKVHVHEVQEVEPCKWLPTGRVMYIDRDAPLGFLKNWDKACLAGHMMLSKTVFDQIVKIVDEYHRKPQKDDDNES